MVEKKTTLSLKLIVKEKEMSVFLLMLVKQLITQDFPHVLFTVWFDRYSSSCFIV